ncbi:amidohydrolase family protein [Coralliovum pocilloporae]|uniref:amidohydrolase family protein n=1 Tax=Coralliovum pocilloporae TaxID=3066369 RepID=UPI003307097F
MTLTGANTLMGLPTGQYDGHCHVFRADLPMAEDRRYTPDYDAKPEELCSLLKAFNLDGALMVQPSFLGADNSYLLQVLADYASNDTVTFKGVAVLDPAMPVDSGWLRELDERGIVGVRLNLLRKAPAFDYETWRQTLAAVEKMGWHIELHSEAEHLPQLLPQLTRHHAKVVVDHFGLVGDINGSSGLRAILDQPEDRLWIKVSGAYRIHPDADRSADADTMAPLRHIYSEHFGENRLIWGSDWPFTQFEDRMSYCLARSVALQSGHSMKAG